MPVYIALLRGVNVGRNTITMERLRAIAAGLGYRNVQTYVQSGNVVFEADGSGTACSKALERKLLGETRLPVTVIVKTPQELRRLIARNPFLKEKRIETAVLHVTFLSEAPAKAAALALQAVKAGDDRCVVAGKEVYIHCPNGYGRSKLANQTVEKMLGVKATTRNWNTVNRLHEMAAS